jgi:hypothetical protein
MTENEDGNIEIGYEEMAQRMGNAFDAGKRFASTTADNSTKPGTDPRGAMDSASYLERFPNAHRLGGGGPAAPGDHTREELFPNAHRLGSGF